MTEEQAKGLLEMMGDLTIVVRLCLVMLCAQIAWKCWGDIAQGSRISLGGKKWTYRD